jgi:putative protease
MTQAKVPELLAPAGGPDAFYAALAAGADAIYCGLGNEFNARRGARNFDDESFQAACRAAHLVGVRVYVTENIVVKQDEMSKALALVHHAWSLGADAMIIQDWGLMSEVRRLWPEIELHVSTQANIHDGRAVSFCRDAFGAKRVTLSRELSLSEIADIAKQTEVDLEVFGHGALCFCYSGICMMSSLAGGRSANRGLCAQPCRLPYDLVDEKGNVVAEPGRTRPLCPKDCCTIDDLSALAALGLTSLKVEGRMKAPDYVWSVVSAYRFELDGLASGNPIDQEKQMRDRRLLRRSFNRDFTDAYLHGVSDDQMMSYERSNNRGELVGTVLSSRDLGVYHRTQPGSFGGRQRVRTHRQAEVTVSFDRDVGAGDLLEIRPDDDPSQFLTSHVDKDYRAGETAILRTARPMSSGSPVRLIRSQFALDAASKASVPQAAPSRKVDIVVVAHLGQPFAVELSLVDGAASVRAEGPVVEAARTKELKADELAAHVCRMGSSPFEPACVNVELDAGCGMAFSTIHKVRRHACDMLEQKLLAPFAERKAQGAEAPTQAQLSYRCSSVAKTLQVHQEAKHHAESPEVCALVSTAKAARIAVAQGASRIYARQASLRQGEWPKDTIPWLDEICRQADHPRLDPLVQAGMPVAVGNMSELALALKRAAQAEIRPCIPVHNESCLLKFETLGAQGIWLSCELTLAEIGELAPLSMVPVGLLVSGRARAMTSEHCVLQTMGHCIHNCAACKLRLQRFSLRDQDGALLPVRTDLQGRSRIYAAHPLDITPQIPELLNAGVTRFMADCTLLSEDELAFSVARVSRAVSAACEGKRPAPRLQGATPGHLFSGIG